MTRKTTTKAKTSPDRVAKTGASGVQQLSEAQLAQVNGGFSFVQTVSKSSPA